MPTGGRGNAWATFAEVPGNGLLLRICLSRAGELYCIQTPDSATLFLGCRSMTSDDFQENHATYIRYSPTTVRTWQGESISTWIILNYNFLLLILLCALLPCNYGSRVSDLSRISMGPKPRLRSRARSFDLSPVGSLNVQSTPYYVCLVYVILNQLHSHYRKWHQFLSSISCLTSIGFCKSQNPTWVSGGCQSRPKTNYSVVG